MKMERNMANVQIYDAKQNKVLTLEKIVKSDKEWKPWRGNFRF